MHSPTSQRFWHLDTVNVPPSLTKAAEKIFAFAGHTPTLAAKVRVICSTAAGLAG
jgi:hypothetical protein